MIDIVTEKDPKLKNIKQIGTPQEEDRIYLSDNAYKRMHEDNFEDKQVFILMGHTESSNGKYATFVEAAIPVTEVEFEHNVPIWNNQVWKSVFTSIKLQYENLIIVGWAMDLKGFPPHETPELEKVHREQFGGVHQLLFLMNSLEREEYFYINKNNHLCRKAGFFVYYQVKAKVSESKKTEKPRVNIEIPEELMSGDNVRVRAKGRYRELLNQQNQFEDMTLHKGDGKEVGMDLKIAKEKKREKSFSVGMVAAIAVLVVAIGVNAMSDGLFSARIKSAVATMGQSVKIQQEQNDWEKGIEYMNEAEEIGTEKETEIIETTEATKTTEEDRGIENKIPVEEY